MRDAASPLNPRRRPPFHDSRQSVFLVRDSERMPNRCLPRARMVQGMVHETSSAIPESAAGACRGPAWSRGDRGRACCQPSPAAGRLPGSTRRATPPTRAVPRAPGRGGTSVRSAPRARCRAGRTRWRGECGARRGIARKAALADGPHQRQRGAREWPPRSPPAASPRPPLTPGAEPRHDLHHRSREQVGQRLGRTLRCVRAALPATKHRAPQGVERGGCLAERVPRKAAGC